MSEAAGQVVGRGRGAWHAEGCSLLPKVELLLGAREWVPCRMSVPRCHIFQYFMTERMSRFLCEFRSDLNVGKQLDHLKSRPIKTNKFSKVVRYKLNP